MALLTWDNRYSVNIKEIDRQHQQLIAIINELHDAMVGKRSKDVLEDILENLVRYTQEHFSYEEHLMQMHEYPGLHEHKEKHGELRQKVLRLQSDRQTGKIVVSLEVMHFLRDWLAAHIQGTDKMYSDFLNSEGVY